MAGSMDGDWAALDRAMSGLIAAERSGHADALRAAAAGVDEQYAADFAGSRDPYGSPWKPTKRGGEPLIGPTLQLANPEVTLTGSSVRVKPVSYWVFHQAGWGSAPERQILPYGPSKWDAPIERKIGDVVERYFR